MNKIRLLLSPGRATNLVTRGSDDPQKISSNEPGGCNSRVIERWRRGLNEVQSGSNPDRPISGGVLRCAPERVI